MHLRSPSNGVISTISHESENAVACCGKQTCATTIERGAAYEVFNSLKNCVKKSLGS